MKIGIAYGLPSKQVWLHKEVPEGCTAREAIERSGILRQCPEIDLEQNKIGIFNKVVPLDTVLTEGDRVEIYRALVVDPKTVKRKAKADSADA